MIDYRSLFELPTIEFERGSVRGEYLQDPGRAVDPSTVTSIPPGDCEDVISRPPRVFTKAPVPEGVVCPGCGRGERLIRHGREAKGRHQGERRWFCASCERVAYAPDPARWIGHVPQRGANKP